MAHDHLINDTTLEDCVMLSRAEEQRNILFEYNFPVHMLSTYLFQKCGGEW